MLRSNLIGTFLAAAALSAGVAVAEPVWVDLEPPEVQLLEAGEGPRQRLRYAVGVGSVQSVRRVQGYELEAKLPLGSGERDAGQVIMEFTLESVAPSGEAPIEVEARLSSLEGPREAGEGLVADGRVRFDDRGRALAARWSQTPTGAEPAMVMLQRFQTRVEGVATPLPAEAVGVGARWQVRQIVEQGTGRFVMVADCRLVADTADGLDIECRFGHETDGATYTLGSGKGARQVELKDSQVDGKALVLQTLDRLAPAREDGDLHTFVKAKAKRGVLRIKVTVDTAERWQQLGD